MKRQSFLWIVVVCEALSRLTLGNEPPRIAGITTEYRSNSHADMFFSRIVRSDTLDSAGRFPELKLKSLFTDQVPANDISREYSQKYGFSLQPTVAKALTQGGDKLAVDGVLLIAEHGKYPKNDVGQIIFPKRRLFEEVFATFRQNGRAVPVFCDKHLADNWEDAKWIYDTARELHVPMMGGSSLPGTWRYPPADVRRGAKLKQIVGLSYHTLDVYGFHALEMVQALAERRAGGETGVRQIRCFPRDRMWQAMAEGILDTAVLEAAISMQTDRRWQKSKPTLEAATKDGNLLVIDYVDGLRACILTANGPFSEWAAGWSYDDNTIEAALFDVQEFRPYYHFAVQSRALERMFHTGRPQWPIERTLLTSGVLHVAHRSLKAGGTVIDTPFLNVAYQSEWNWQQPPERPKNRTTTD